MGPIDSSTVELWLAMALSGACGALIATAAALAVARSRTRARQLAAKDAPPEIPAELAEAMMNLVRSPSMLVSKHDEVTHSSSSARAMGMVRGSRIGVNELLDLVRRARREGQNLSQELQIQRGPSVAPIPVSARVANLGGGMMLVIAYDLAPELRIDETRRDFVANISHELKTPIGAISVLAEAIQVASGDSAEVVRFATRMQAEASRLGELVAQIVDLSRLQADDPLLKATVVDVDQVVVEAISRHRAVAESRNISIVPSLGGDSFVLGDQAQLAEAVSNLISNAIAYSADRTRVAVSTRRSKTEDDELVSIIVADNGIGIREQDQERVFERFYRVDQDRSRRSGGSGLGLAIVKHIIAAHRGSISLWSQPGHGSTFTLRLPAHLPKPAAVEES